MSNRNRKPAKGKKLKVGNRPFFVRVKEDVMFITDWKDRIRTMEAKIFMDHKGKIKWSKLYDHISARW